MDSPAPTIQPPSGATSLNEHDLDEKRTIADDGDVVEKGEQQVAPVTVVDPPPDGGLRAWLLVIGSACAGFCTFGFANAFGVFQAYYTETIPGASQFKIAWIGSLQYALIFLPGLLAGHLADQGHYRSMSLTASAVLITSIFLVAECKTLWQLVLCQGFAIGGSSGFLFMPTLAIIPQWFDKHRPLAYGVFAVGSSFGGSIVPVVVRKLFPSVGFKWTIRTVGFIIAFALVLLNLTVKPRIFKRSGGKFPLGEFLRNKVLYSLGTTLMWFGIYVPLAFFDVYAQSIGVPAEKSYLVVVTANAASLIGRLSGGVLANPLGPLNVLMCTCVIAAILTVAWPHTTSFTTLEVVATLYGIVSGMFVSLLPSPSGAMVPRHQAGAVLGFVCTAMSIGALVGNPIAGQIVENSGFKAAGGYAGAMVFFSVGICLSY
ncbi:hypothetical protein FRB99_007902 [Tulasnella sp. 403]|nr:hypothetical protein FRB99_007902 [Tulasnella sp. 403]